MMSPLLRHTTASVTWLFDSA